MTSVTIYHNPRCSKSRQTLALLEEKGVETTIVEYLSDTPSASDIQSILNALGITARELLRTGEDEYTTMNLADESLTEEQIIEAMTKAPILIQRPVVVAGDQARIGRPPESVLEIL